MTMKYSLYDPLTEAMMELELAARVQEYKRGDEDARQGLENARQKLREVVKELSNVPQ